MNFMAGTLEEGKLRTVLGDLPLAPQLRQALEHANPGRQVIVGIRPENFEDASLVQPDEREHGITFRATIDVVESMGSDVFVYFTQDGGLSATTDRARGARPGLRPGRRQRQATRRWSPGSIRPPASREGEEAELWVDIADDAHLRPGHRQEPVTRHRARHEARGDACRPPAT